MSSTTGTQRKTPLEIATKYKAGKLSKFYTQIFDAYAIAGAFERGKLSVVFPELPEAYEIWIHNLGDLDKNK
jgi:hypothetical protein